MTRLTATGLRPAVALPLALALLALLLRLYGLADKPFWYDEIVTLNRTNLPLVDLIIDAFRHKHFPTYFMVVAPFASTSPDEWTLRLPSAMFGAVCVFLVARLARDVRGSFAGLVAGLLMALSPAEVQYGQEARPYTLISCMVLIALCGLVRIEQTSRQAVPAQTGPVALSGAWAAYGFGTIGALLMENNTLPWLLASNLALVTILARRPSGQRSLLRNWGWTEAAILLVWLPVLILMFTLNRGAVMTGLEWVPKATWEDTRSIFAAVYLFRISDMMTFGLSPTLLPGFGAIVLALALFGAWRLKSDPALLVVIGLAFLAMPIAILAISIFKPVLVPRYMLWSTGPFFVLAGIGAAALPARLSPVIVAIVAVGGALSLAPYYGSETKPRWDQAAAYLARNIHTQQDVVVAANRAVKFVLASYDERLHPDSKFPIHAWTAVDTAQCAAADARVWVIYGRVGQGIQESEADFRGKWSAFGSPAAQIRFGAHILILRFDGVPIPPQRDFDSVQLEPHVDSQPIEPYQPNP